jgi:hypothetical protein
VRRRIQQPPDARRGERFLGPVPEALASADFATLEREVLRQLHASGDCPPWCALCR